MSRLFSYKIKLEGMQYLCRLQRTSWKCDDYVDLPTTRCNTEDPLYLQFERDHLGLRLQATDLQGGVKHLHLLLLGAGRHLLHEGAAVCPHIGRGRGRHGQGAARGAGSATSR